MKGLRCLSMGFSHASLSMQMKETRISGQTGSCVLFYHAKSFCYLISLKCNSTFTPIQCEHVRTSWTGFYGQDAKIQPCVTGAKYITRQGKQERTTFYIKRCLGSCASCCYLFDFFFFKNNQKVVIINALEFIQFNTCMFIYVFKQNNMYDTFQRLVKRPRCLFSARSKRA